MRVRWVRVLAPENGAQDACWRAEFATMVRLREFVARTADGVAPWEHVPVAPAHSRRLKDGERVATVDRSRIPKDVWPREGGDAPAVPDVRHAEPAGNAGRGRLEAAPNAAALGSTQKMRDLLAFLSLTYAEQSKQIQARSAGYCEHLVRRFVPPKCMPGNETRSNSIAREDVQEDRGDATRDATTSPGDKRDLT
jgi:hypothetical protein